MNTPNYKRKRPAPRKATGWGRPVSDTVTWDRILDPHEHYQLEYVDRDGVRSTRTIELCKIGHDRDTVYLGITELGRFKTLRADRVVGVVQLSEGHACSLRAMPTYADKLPAFPLPNALYKVPTTAVSGRTWTVNLNEYTCTCPEKRIRRAKGYAPGQLGYVCDHMAKAILQDLPADAAGWTPELRAFLADPRRIHIDHLS